jgi:Tetracyclin repressor-like, C-terminal domain
MIAPRRSRAPSGPDELCGDGTEPMLGSISAVPIGYHLDPAQEIHALRMLRSMMHGFATLEGEGGFRLDTDVNDSFAWMVDLIDHGLQSAPGPSDLPASVTVASVPSPSLTGAP